MIKTNTGYKIVINNNHLGIIDGIKKPFVSIKDGYDSTVEGFNAVNEFFSNLSNEGLWYAVTGQYFGEWVYSITTQFIHWVVSVSDVLLIAGIGSLLLVMFGSKRSRKWIYWIICSYIIIQIVGWMI